jgi:hypothetical protein
MNDVNHLYREFINHNRKIKGEYASDSALHKFLVFIWYTYRQLLPKTQRPALGQIWIGAVGQYWIGANTENTEPGYPPALAVWSTQEK